MSDRLDLTRLIGVISLQRNTARSRQERKRLERLVRDLCDIASAVSQLRAEADKPHDDESDTP